MTAKRFTKYVPDSYNYTSIITIVDHETNKRSGSIDDFVDMMNALHEENEQLKLQLQNTSDQRDEFHRGARENANRVGKLKKEIEQLKSSDTITDLETEIMKLKQENEQLKKELKNGICPLCGARVSKCGGLK